ncbi:uncharacterized protein METZ01_LOCUS97364 [marine metagenome]|uniref:Uncharacterized protein n=1 Tax=marine metagenome TaxID=408172 RepID=A0A381VW40_9ZZZZ
MTLDTFAYPYPGKSTILSFSLILNKLIDCVLPGVLLVLANFLDFVIALIMLDFPTFERPTKQHSGS